MLLQGHGLLQQLPALLLELFLRWYFLVIIGLGVGVHHLMDLCSRCAIRGRRRFGEVGRIRELYRLVSLAPEKKTRRDEYDEYDRNKNEGLAQRPVTPEPDYHGWRKKNECEV